MQLATVGNSRRGLACCRWLPLSALPRGLARKLPVHILLKKLIVVCQTVLVDIDVGLIVLVLDHGRLRNLLGVVLIDIFVKVGPFLLIIDLFCLLYLWLLLLLLLRICAASLLVQADGDVLVRVDRVAVVAELAFQNLQLVFRQVEVDRRHRVKY